MKYMGSKNRHAKEILQIVLKDRKQGQWYVEPFVGGCNVIDKVDGNRIGSDIHYYLMSMWQAVSKGWNPPDLIVTEEDYKHIRENKEQYPPELVGYVGFSLSYGGKFFGGWRRDSVGKRNYVDEAYRSDSKQFRKLRGVSFYNKDYFELDIPDCSVIYCDPPYAGTTKYSNDFDHEKFWQWCRDKVKEGHKVFVSEYNAPDDFVCLWEKTVNNTLTKDTGSKQGVEKLFTITYCG